MDNKTREVLWNERLQHKKGFDFVHNKVNFNNN